jgi:hypothetical protein
MATAVVAVTEANLRARLQRPVCWFVRPDIEKMAGLLAIQMLSALQACVRLVEFELADEARALKLPINHRALNYDVGKSAALSAALADFQEFSCCRKDIGYKTLHQNVRDFLSGLKIHVSAVRPRP